MAANRSALEAEPPTLTTATRQAYHQEAPARHPVLFTMRRRFTVEDYHRMAELGLIGPDEGTELLDGEVVFKMAINSVHAGCVNRLNGLLSTATAGRAIVAVQNPVRLDDRSEPEPDLSILKPRTDAYSRAHPGPADVLWLIEVAETSRHLDRAVKVPLYAASGVAEVWLVDLVAGAIEVYRDPDAAGYRVIHRHVRGEMLRPTAFGDIAVSVDDVLGSPDEAASAEDVGAGA